MCTRNNNFDFVFTNDGSTGLYNYDVNDIYHSSYGAKTEAVQKFINPLDFYNNFYHNKNIEVLDICYGIGYNTKALLNKIFKLNYKGNVNIDILEYDKRLVLLSPFIKDGFFKETPEVSYFILNNLFDEIYRNKEQLSCLLKNKSNNKFFEPFYLNLIKKYKYFGYSYNLYSKNNSVLHNIYYQCISSRNKKAPRGLKIKDLSITPHFQDARISVKSLDKRYDIIFLDAFTPAKLPTLWSLEFFNELYRLISNDGMLVTYSNSAAVRHAMLESGFYVGKIYDKNNRASGTCASKNSDLIKNKLDDYDLGLIKTNAGIYFRDENLNSTSEEILKKWNEDKLNLKLESSSHYIKTHRKLKD